METVPRYWKTTLEDIEESMQSVKLGEVTTLCHSPGGRPVYQVFYGKENNLHRTANRSSALGAADESCFVDRSDADYRPTVMVACCVHGGEFEGTAAILNLISLMETGVDTVGEKHDELLELAKKVNWVIIPCTNPDGRSHVPFASFVGKTMYDLRYYNQGTWKDGTLCGWPECKKIFPVKDKVDYLGGYFNDDGVNFMHDNFFGDKAAETDALFRAAEKYAPDFVVLPHGGSNTTNVILAPAFAPQAIKDEIDRLEDDLQVRCEKANVPFARASKDMGENGDTPASFNLISALYQICGVPCVTYESNQGLDIEGSLMLNHDEIYREHIALLESICAHVLNKKSI